MTTIELLQKAWYRYKGAKTFPVEGTTKYAYMLSTANDLIEEWARDGNQTWASLWELRNEGSVSTSTDYFLDDDFIKPSDFIYVETDDAQRAYFDIQKPQSRSRYGRSVYVSQNPGVLSFVEALPEDSTLIGGTLWVAGYWVPQELVNANDTVVVDNPQWLIYAIAAELARNDPAKTNQYGNLQGRANDLYENMVSRNISNGFGQPLAVAVQMPQINPYNYDEQSGASYGGN